MCTFACIMERDNRTFRRRVDYSALLLLLLLVAIAVAFLWHRSTGNAVIGFILIAVLVVVMERIFHTEYRFQGNVLTVYKGRFSTPITINVNEIVRITRVKRLLLRPAYLLVEYGTRQEVALQPVNDTAFINEIHKRQDNE